MKLRRMLALCTVIALTGTAFVSCGGKDGSSSDATPENGSAAAEERDNSSAEQPSAAPETDEEWQSAMIDASMTSYGNTKMMHDVIEKAQSGEEVTIAYLGGSITEGATAGAERCYAKLSFTHFAEKFGTGDNVKYVNAGISGTPSKLGILRLDRDVLAYDPDIVFLEFAVNDGNDAEHQNAYESIVRTLLQKDIAVVLLFSVTEGGHSCQDYMQQIGEAYSLPMISYRDALRFMFDNGRMTWKDFSDDTIHPNAAGHAMVAQMVNNYWDTVLNIQPEGEQTMPINTVFAPRQENSKMAENDGITPLDMGSWVTGSDVAHFTKGWKHNPSAGNDPIVFELDARFIHLVYKEVSSGDYGDLRVHITANGEEYSDRGITVISPNGWGNPQLVNVAMTPSPKTFRIEISMADGCEDMQGQLLAIGYTP